MNTLTALSAFAKLTLLLAILTACQSRPSLTTTTETRDRIAVLTTEDEYRDSYEPVKLSRLDVLTEETKVTIENNNNVYWCRYQDKRPEGFDASICPR